MLVTARRQLTKKHEGPVMKGRGHASGELALHASIVERLSVRSAHLSLPVQRCGSFHPHNALTPAFVRNVNQAGRYCDGQGLYLDVRPTGSRGWIPAPHHPGPPNRARARRIPLVSLKEAREKAFEFLVLTATRSGEVRGAAWTEIDRDEGV